MLFNKMPKFFAKKNKYTKSRSHNHSLDLQKSVTVLNLRRIQRSRLTLDQYIRIGLFTCSKHAQTVLEIYPAVNLPKKANHYIALHTAYGIFYVYNGIEWLHSETGIYIEHESDDMQKWLLSRALDALPKNSFMVDVQNLHVHQYIRTKEYEGFYLNGIDGLTGRAIYGTIDSWNKLFKTCKFKAQNVYAVDNICIHKPVILGKQSITIHDYNKLRCGNIILLNETYIQADGFSNIALGGFILQSVYENGGLVFQAWDRNMNDKTYNNHNNDDDENDEWEDENDGTLDNPEYIDDMENVEEDYAEEEEYNEENHEEDESTYTEDDAQDETYDSDGYEEDDADDDAQAAQNASNVHQTKNNQQSEINEDAHPFANVPIQLLFSLGSLRMPIANLLQLQEGSVIELHKSIPAQVQIYANKRLIGGGEVVEIDGKLGVQIIHMQQDM